MKLVSSFLIAAITLAVRQPHWVVAPLIRIRDSFSSIDSWGTFYGHPIWPLDFQERSNSYWPFEMKSEDTVIKWPFLFQIIYTQPKVISQPTLYGMNTEKCYRKYYLLHVTISWMGGCEVGYWVAAVTRKMHNLIIVGQN